MKKAIIAAIILLILPFWLTAPAAGTLEDSTTATAARFAAGLTLENGVPVGTLALITQINPTFYNASSLLSTGKQGALSSQVFWNIYRAKAFLVAVGIGASLDIIQENPTYDQSVTYLSAASGLAFTVKPDGNIMFHVAFLILNPSPIDRDIRFYALLSLPLSS